MLVAMIICVCLQGLLTEVHSPVKLVDDVDTERIRPMPICNLFLGVLRVGAVSEPVPCRISDR